MTTPAPAATAHHPERDAFIHLLRHEILRLDDTELDFGIWRVLRHRKEQIEAFLAVDLPERIATALLELPGSATSDEEARLYNHLLTFFKRYYDDGDFLPRARRNSAAGRSAYAVPYDGSDTHFHWATKGSHYVKSGQRFASYAYRQDNGTRVRLTVAEAHTERDNAKGDTRFYIGGAPQAPCPEHPDEWRLPFAYRPLTEAETARVKPAKRKTAGSDEEDAQQEADGTPEGATPQDRLLNDWLGALALPAGLERAALERNTRRWLRGHASDFFVHPQLGNFLRGELEHYLRAEFVNAWELPDGEALLRERGKFLAVRRIGLALIELLAALEDLQARLFEKRKFVLGSDWLVQAGYLAGLGEQGTTLLGEAVALGAVGARWRGWAGESDSSVQASALLARFPHLPLYTADLSEDLRWRLLALLPDLHGSCGGWLIHGDNYAALRTLEPGWRAGVKCIYIDPPYNTGKDGFLYKDGYFSSSWSTLLFDRIGVAKPLLTSSGTFLASIDERERANLSQICLSHFGESNQLGSLVWKGSTDNNPSRIAIEHEYILAYAEDSVALEEVWSAASNETKDWILQSFDRICAEQSETAIRQELFANFAEENREALGDLYRYRRVDSHGLYAARRNMENPGKPGYQYDIWHPISGRACAKPLWGWRFPPETMERFLRADRIIFGDDESKIPELKVYLRDVKFPLRSVIQLDARKGSNELDRLFGSREIFKNPKPVDLLCAFLPFVASVDASFLDFFAGSGTTAHAVLNLNRADGGQRRFILVEQGEYFDTVTLPRVAKVMTSPEWKDGRPKDSVQHDAQGDEDHWSRRTLPLVQVLRLERYEDSLDALALPQSGGQGELAGFDALLRYLAEDSLGDTNPVRLNTAHLRTPFDYRLPTVWEGRAVERPVDLLMTTCLLLGLHLQRLRRVQRSDSHPVLLAEVRAHRPGLPVADIPLELLVLRDHDPEGQSPADLAQAAEAEYRWLADAVPNAFGRTLAEYACVHHNRDLVLLGEGEVGRSIDTPLAEAMWARDPAYSGRQAQAEGRP